MKGWEEVPLEELGKITSSKRIFKSEYVDAGIPFYRTKEIKELANGRKVSTELYISKDKFNEINQKFGTPAIGDLLMTAIGTIGEIYVVDNTNFYFKDGNVLWLKDFKNMSPEFLKYTLMAFIDELNSLSHGSAYSALPIEKLKKHKILKPPLSEQKRIVSIVDEAFEAIDTAIDNTKQNLTNARELFESYLNAIFTQACDGWEEKTLRDVCVFQGGSQPPKSAFSMVKKEGYIRLIQIRDYKSDKYIVYIPQKDARRFCKPDDIMIGRYGPPLFQILRGIEGAYNVALMKAIPNEKLISKDFLFYFLKNQKILKYIIDSSSRTAGQTGINKATIEPYPIFFPSLEKQAIIVSQLEDLKIQTQQLEAIYRQKLTALNELKQSILHKAFTGELTADTADLKTNIEQEAIAV